MRRITCILGAVCLATATRAEEPGSAPLEGAKQELKQLQAEQAGRGGSVSGKMTDGLPRFQTPLPGAMPEEVPRPERVEEELKQRNDAQKNWLLDGVDKLAQTQRIRGKESVHGVGQPFKSDEGKAKSDGSGPNYLLRLYAEQKKNDEARGGQQKSSGLHADPWAPFLQDWLASSPVRGKFFDEFVRKADRSGSTAKFPGSPLEQDSSQGLDAREMTVATGSGEAVARPNPYLQGLDTPARQDPGGGQAQVTTNEFGLSNPTAGAMPDGRSESLARERSAENKPRWLPESDDKKYYPQLKKF